MTNITIKLIGSNADEITLAETDGTYVLSKSVQGLGLPTKILRISESAGDGGTYIGSRRASRTISLGIHIFGTDRQDIENNLRRLGNLISDRKGPTKIVVTYNTTPSTSYSIEAYLSDGGDIDYSKEATNEYAYTVLEFKAPLPYWTNTATTTTTLTGAGITNVTISNTGDIETYPVYKIKGIVGSIQLSNANGSLKYEDPIASGETITIDTINATVVNQLGDNKYAGLALSPKMFALPEGTSTLNITATGIGAGAELEITYHTRREIVF